MLLVASSAIHFFLFRVGSFWLLWTGVIFLGLYWFGSMFWSELSSVKWGLLPFVIIVILLLHRKFKPSIEKMDMNGVEETEHIEKSQF